MGGAGKGKETRKKRPPVTISEEQEAAALEFLKNHPLLYDRSMKEYKEVSRREKLWEELADQVTTKRNPIKREDIKKWFESQRTIYGKSTKLTAFRPEEVGCHRVWLSCGPYFQTGNQRLPV